MAKVKALKDVYLGEHGYHAAGEVFDYAGPENKNLQPLERSKADIEDDEDTKYHAMTREALQAELESRGIDFKPNAKDATLRKLLEADDDSK